MRLLALVTLLAGCVASTDGRDPGATASGVLWHPPPAPRAQSLTPLGATPAGLGPAELARAYALDSWRRPQQPLVAIVNFAHYAEAETDLAAYRAHYDLPACTVANGCLKIVNQTGAASPLPPPPAAGDVDWNDSAAGGLEMVSAVCPHCTLLLVEAGDANGMLSAQAVAARLGAAVIVDDWVLQTTPAQSLEGSFTLDRPVTIFSALWAGAKYAFDPEQYPATSAHVIAVASSKLVAAPGTARGWRETASLYSQSSCSKSVPTPGWQSGVATRCTFRGTPDIAVVGDFDSGVALYLHGRWQTSGGEVTTGALAAGIFALYDLGGAGPQLAYEHPEAWFDITVGSGGACDSASCAAGHGWDAVTGQGSPNGAVLARLSPRHPEPPPDLAEPPADAADDLGPAPAVDAAAAPPVDAALVAAPQSEALTMRGGCSFSPTGDVSGDVLAVLLLVTLLICGFVSRCLGRTSNP